LRLVPRLPTVTTGNSIYVTFESVQSEFLLKPLALQLLLLILIFLIESG